MQVMYEQLAAVYRDVVGDLPYRGWAELVRDAWSVDDDGVHAVLDVCCGTGLLTAELISFGYELTGTDGSPAMLEQARSLLGPDVPLSLAVLPELALRGTFDAAVCTFDSLNYLQPDAFATAIAVVGQHLRPGGWFVFDLHTEQMMRTIAAAPDAAGRSGALDLSMSSAVDLAKRTVTTRVRVEPDDAPPFVEEHHQHFFSVDEVRAAAAAAGFAVVAVTDDYTTAPLTDQSMRATWVLRRPVESRSKP